MNVAVTLTCMQTSKWIFNFLIPPHLTDGGREKHLWMLGVWSISSVSRLWRLYRLFHQRASVPIEFTAIVCQALHLPLILPPRLALLFTCFGDLAGGSKSSTLGMSARVWSVRGVSGCGRVIQRRSDVVESSLDELIETSDVEDFFSNVVDRLTLCTWAQWGQNSWRTLESW